MSNREQDAELGKVIHLRFEKPRTVQLPEPDDLLEEEIFAEEEAFESAQDICLDAFALESANEKVAAAIEALSMHPKCTDAWYLLGSFSSEDPMTKLGLFRNGMHSAMEYYGDNFENMGLWADERTRPFMRCRRSFAMSLWAADLKELGADEACSMLEDNPKDNQEMRLLAMAWLLTLGRFDSARKLYFQYEADPSMEWVMAELILQLKGQLPGDPWETLRRNARNKHLIPFLATRRRIPKLIESETLVKSGAEYEVQACLQSFRDFPKAQKKLWLLIQEGAAGLLDS